MEQEHGLKKENSYMLNSGDSAAFARLRWTSSQVNVSTQDLWRLVTFGLEEIISSMAVVTFSGQRIPAFDKKLNYTLPDEEVKIEIKRRHWEGQCYTLKMSKSLKQKQIKNVGIKWCLGYGLEIFKGRI